ncbi:hypothetical protein BDF14DRAFT_1791923 [Spinellus fusiger]|nr:hypothetical protein BDF14DRAFT_1791923 [Spinellus fusiger]
MKFPKITEHLWGISPRAYALMSEIALFIVSILMVVLGLLFTPVWAYQMKIGDLYTYSGILILVVLWCVSSIFSTSKHSVKGVRTCTNIMAVLTGIQFLVGCIHIMLLYLYYRPAMMSSCLQRQSARLFIWSPGYENIPEMLAIRQACDSDWNAFAAWRIIIWAIMTVMTLLCFISIKRYSHELSPHVILHSYDDDTEEGHHGKTPEKKYMGHVKSNDPDNQEESDHLLGKTSEKDQDEKQPSHQNDSSHLTMAKDMYRQRQKLYAEIAKRRYGRDNSRRRSKSHHASRKPSTSSVHPLDLANPSKEGSMNSPVMKEIEKSHLDATKAEEYYDLPYYPADSDDTQGMETEEFKERTKRQDSFSAEKMDYENYRANHQNTPSPNGPTSKMNEGGGLSIRGTQSSFSPLGVSPGITMEDIHLGHTSS